MGIEGTIEEIPLRGPRYASGALGFKSKVSIWLGPPNWCKKIIDLAFALGFAARRVLEKGEPKTERAAPCLIKLLRENISKAS
jgi:hypothetical protein